MIELLETCIVIGFGLSVGIAGFLAIIGLIIGLVTLIGKGKDD